MYSPKIKEELIRPLYKLRKRIGKPMTVIVNQFVMEGINSLTEYLDIKEIINNPKKPFEIVSVCRADLKGYYSDEEIEYLSDDDLKIIAIRMADEYCDNDFWTDLKKIAKPVINEAKSREET